MELNITDSDYRTKMMVLEALHQVYDPELNINIVDLGLVYELYIEESAKEIKIEMTLSSPSCPLGSFITNHAALAAELAVPGYKAIVDLVWEPKWSADRVSPEGKTQLGW